jgi:cardiolipin synthase
MPTIGPSLRKPLVGPAPRALAPAPARASQPAPPTIWQHRLLTGKGNLPLQHVVLDNPTFHNKITMHDSADESMLALLDGIRTAKKSYYVETFIWHNDEAGRQVAQALIDRKKAAIAKGEPFDVKIIIDFSGEHDPTVATKDMKIIDFMRSNGLDVRTFNNAMINPLATGRSPITHRKLYIKDGSQFSTGGRNIGDEYLKATFFDPKGKQERAWHDLLYTVEGDETGRVLNEFFKNWVRCGGKMPAVRPTIEPSPTGTSLVQSFTTNPLDHTHGILDAQLKAIGAAKQEIRVVYPYLSDESLVQALLAAKKARPALQIKVMIPGHDEGGVSGFLYANLNDYAAWRLILAGIDVRKIDSYHDGDTLATTFSHLKGMVIDGTLLSIGSANGDARTMHDNHELNTLIYDPTTAQKFIHDVLEDDWQLAKPVTIADLDNKKWYARLTSWLLQRIAFLF